MHSGMKAAKKKETKCKVNWMVYELYYYAEDVVSESQRVNREDDAKRKRMQSIVCYFCNEWLSRKNRETTRDETVSHEEGKSWWRKTGIQDIQIFFIRERETCHAVLGWETGGRSLRNGILKPSINQECYIFHCDSWKSCCTLQRLLHDDVTFAVSPLLDDPVVQKQQQLLQQSSIEDQKSSLL